MLEVGVRVPVNAIMASITSGLDSDPCFLNVSELESLLFFFPIHSPLFSLWIRIGTKAHT